jgi:hypothetical protein
VIPGVMSTGVDPHRAELEARQAADITEQVRMDALENVARDGFPRVSGQVMEGLRRDGLVREQPGRVPYALTLAGVDAILAHREANR